MNARTRIIKAFLRENMPILVQGDALKLVEIDATVQVEELQRQGKTGRHNSLLWADTKTTIDTIKREFVSLCLENQGGDSAAA